MDFEVALENKNIEVRNQLIENEIHENEWDDYLTSYCVHGGYPTDILILKLEIDEDLKSILVNFSVSFTKSLPTSCKEVVLDYEASAFFSVSINKQNADFEINCDYGEGDGDELFSGDYL